MSFWRTFIDPRVLALSFIYFANLTTNLGLAFFLPQMIKEIGFSTFQSGLVTSIPYIVGAIGALLWGYFSDRYNERRISLFLALLVSAIGLAGAALLGSTIGAVAWMSVAAIGIYGAKAPFWPLPSMFLTGSAAAGGIALDQLRRQPGWVCRTIYYGLGQGCHWELQGRTVRPGWVWYRGRRRYVDGR